jgi:hypothetical protein
MERPVQLLERNGLDEDGLEPSRAELRHDRVLDVAADQDRITAGSILASSTAGSAGAAWLVPLRVRYGR